VVGAECFSTFGAVLGILVGLMLVTHPVWSSRMDAVVRAYFIVIGILRIIFAPPGEIPRLGLGVIRCSVTLILALLLCPEWPVICFPGFALRITLILRGWATVMFVLAVRAFNHRVMMERVA